MPPFLKKKELWGTIIAVVLLAYCVKDIRLADVEKLIERVNFYYLIPALVMEFLLIVLRAVRWRTIVEKTRKIRMLRVITLYSAGQVINIVMPVLTGQVGRLLLFSKREGLSKTYVFSTIVIEILFDAISLLVLILLLSMAFVFPAEYRSISYIIAAVTISLLVMLYLMLQFKNQIGTLGRKILRHRWPGVYITLKKFALSFTRGIALLRSTEYFFRTLILSFTSWGVHIMIIYFLFESFGFEFPLIIAVVVMVINTIVLMVPITPGNAGTFELAVVAPLLAFKVVKSDAVLYALALHILDFIPIFVMGFFFLHTERMTLKEIKEEGEKEEVLEQVEDEVIVEKDAS
ncbi:MAG: flippase-like domain-containing protein [Candidatus Zixiibacteriota bacterium]|nr:MAG: flippase-like domain-containing protein [candidate division Zixibacteria bacterium]